MTLHWSDLIIFPSIAQGLFIALALWQIKSRNKGANRVLGLYMICCTAMLIGRLLYWRLPESLGQPWILLPDTIIFLFGPLLYLFIVRLLFEKGGTQVWLHFVPAATYLSSAIFFMSIGQSAHQEMLVNGKIYVYYFFVELLGIISNGFYVGWSFLATVRHIKVSKGRLSYKQKQWRFVLAFLIAIALISSIWTISFISSQFFSTYIPFVNYNVIWVLLPLLTYLIGYYMLLQPDLFRVTIVSSGASKERLDEDEQRLLSQKLETLLSVEKLYEDAELTLKMLADKLGTTTNNLSWLLNSVYQQSFYDFINHHRIKSFIEHIEHGRHQSKTILGIAMEVGFKSKSTFNKAFKMETGTTPSLFIRTYQEKPQTEFRYSA